MENLNIHGMFQQKMGTKTTKNRIIQTTNNDKIQITMVRQKIHTSRPFSHPANYATTADTKNKT